MTKFQEHDMNNGLLNQVLMWHNAAAALHSRKLEILVSQGCNGECLTFKFNLHFPFIYC